MDPNQSADQNSQDLMIAPEDTLMTTDNKTVAEPTAEVSYTPPRAWGADQSAAPVGAPPADFGQTTSPIIQTTPIPNLQASSSTDSWGIQGQTDMLSTQPQASRISLQEMTPFQTTTPPIIPLLPETPSSQQTIDSGTSPVFRTLLIGLALILLGTLLGILAARFLPPVNLGLAPVVVITQPTPSVIAGAPEATATIQATPTVEITPIPAPTATPSALLNLKWNMMTVKSPVSFFSSYRLYYPTTWSIKEYKNTAKANDVGTSSLILQKGKATMTIQQGNTEASSCSYDDSVLEGSVYSFADYRTVNKEGHLWRWGTLRSGTIPTYPVCELTSGNFSSQTSIGFISLTGSDLDTAATEEFNYILEKIIIVK